MRQQAASVCQKLASVRQQAVSASQQAAGVLTSPGNEMQRGGDQRRPELTPVLYSPAPGHQRCQATRNLPGHSELVIAKNHGKDSGSFKRLNIQDKSFIFIIPFNMLNRSFTLIY